MKRYIGLQTLLAGLASILILLWIYTAFSKVIEYDEFKRQLVNQVFSQRFTKVLAFVLPTIEILTGVLLLFRKSRLAGFVLSALLMGTFSIYIALVLSGYYNYTPCSCGGVLKSLSWQAHLWFNGFFLFIALLGTYLQIKFLKKRREDTSIQ